MGPVEKPLGRRGPRAEADASATPPRGVLRENAWYLAGACCLVVASLRGQMRLGPLSASLVSPRRGVASSYGKGREGPRSEFLAADGSFPGAREWYESWSRASRKGRDLIVPDHDHDKYVAAEADAAAKRTMGHIENMKERYENVSALPDFYARGLGWIQDRLGMVLTVVIVAGDSVGGNPTGNATELRAGPASIFVVDVVGDLKCNGGKDEGDDDWIDTHPPLTMWARANGPEIFAGTLLPHPWKDSRCAWRYAFTPQRAGAYSIHVKVLTFDGFLDFNASECGGESLTARNDMFDRQKVDAAANQSLEELEATNANAVRELAEQGNYLHHRGVTGFKVYGTRETCCEACTRARNCKMWSSPGAGHFDNCELYFDRVEDDLDFLDRDNGRYLGRKVGYSYMKQVPSDFPNVRRKLSHRKLAVSSNEYQKIWPVGGRPEKGTPRASEHSHFIGCGWSSLMTFENPCHYPSDDLVFGSGQLMHIPPGNLAPLTPLCTLDNEQLSRSHGRWVRYPYPDHSVCPPMVRDTVPAAFAHFRPKYHGDRDPKCWHRNDLTQLGITCAEPGCRFVINHRWMTDLKKESKWFGKWEPYECAYKDMGDDMIQRCIDRKNISSIKLEGVSIRNVVDSYMVQRLEKINMANAGEGTLSVVLDTLKWPHLLWRNSIGEYKQHLADNFPNVTGNNIEHYFLTGFYLTSEREPHVTVDRSLQFSQIASDILIPKGYKMINGFDLTAAFAFDTDGQADGLHILGPPIQAIVTKFFHHLCHHVVT